jgi:ATP-dependent Zn protease
MGDFDFCRAYKRATNHYQEYVIFNNDAELQLAREAYNEAKEILTIYKDLLIDTAELLKNKTTINQLDIAKIKLNTTLLVDRKYKYKI